jgi:hypothetical protein
MNPQRKSQNLRNEETPDFSGVFVKKPFQIASTAFSRKWRENRIFLKKIKAYFPARLEMPQNLKFRLKFKLTHYQIVLIHQYLYYVMNAPIWSDYEYDRYCKAHGLEGGGGSDRASDYSAEIANLAKRAQKEAST